MSTPSLWRAASIVLLASALMLGCNERKTLVSVPETVDSFQQGTANETSVGFVQKTALVDVLFVVDNSPSMCEKQQNLAQKFQSFITSLQSQDLDFHIGVVASDMSAGTYQGKLVAAGSNPRVLTAQTPNLVQVFGQNVAAVGLAGSSRSQGLLAAQAALTQPLVSGVNTGFFRPDASLAIIFVSDEDDYSLNTVDAPEPDYFVRHFQRTFQALKGAGNEGLVKLSAIVAVDPNGAATDCTGSGTTNAACTFHDLNGHAATRYAAVAAATKGLSQSICASDFGPLLTTIASNIGGLIRRYELQRISVDSALDPRSLTVTMTPAVGSAVTVPQDAANGWTYDAATQTLTFAGTGIPPPRSDVAIRYVVLARAFHLTNAPTTSTVTVDVTADGVTTRVDPTADDPDIGWTYDAQAQSIVFGAKSIPPAGATIDVTYRF